MCRDVGPQLLGSHAIMGGKQYTQNHSVSRQPSCCSLLVQYSTNYKRQFTLYYKISFVLDDFAALELE